MPTTNDPLRDCVVGMDDQEGAVLLVESLDQASRFFGQTCGEVLAVRTVGEPRIPVGREEAGGSPGGVAPEIHLEAVRLRPVGRFFAEVPFADVSGAITLSLQCLGEGRLARGQGARQRGILELLRARARDPVRDDGPRGILAGHEAVTRRRAHRIGGIPGGKARSALRQPVEVRRFVKRVRVIEADVHRAEIVGHEDHDIRRT
jgi:hypothetical protein